MGSLKNKKGIVSIVSTVAFFGTFIATILSFVLNLLKFANNNQMAISFDFPIYYYVLSIAFTIIICLMVGFSYYFRSKLMVLIPLCYLVVTSIVFLCLFILMSNPSVDTYVLQLMAFSVFAPLYGFWVTVNYYIALLILLPLFFASAIITYKIFKLEKLEKLEAKSKKKNKKR